MRGGFVVATDVERTAGRAAALRLVPDRAAMTANRVDCLQLEIDVVDDRGTLCPYGDARVTVEVTGPARLVGLDNGDPLDLDSSKTGSRRAFRGKLVAVVQATDEAGDVTVVARADGLSPATFTLPALPAMEESQP